jgi:urease accessory protein
MRSQSSSLAWIAALGLLVSQSAGAHVLYTDDGLLAGFSHPFLGIDHLLAMLAVGFWAAQTGGRALWAVPLTFMATLAAGAWLGTTGFPLPAVKAGIAASVLALGLLVALAIRLPLAAGMALTSVFALFHGHAHGTELPAMVSPLVYAAGFVVATGLLHASGLAAAFALNERRLRLAGACVAVAGAFVAAGV